MIVRFIRAFCQAFLRELNRLSCNRFDLAMVMIAPLVIIVLFGAMFYHGKAHHLPVALVDEDNSELSHLIYQHIHHNETVEAVLILDDIQDAHHAINRLDVGGYIHIPKDAQNRLVRGENTGIHIAYNQSFFSIGSAISSALSKSTKGGIAKFIQTKHLTGVLPHLSGNMPHVKISVLFNPNLSYEFFLEPFLVAAVLHLLLCCLVAHAIGQEFHEHSVYEWLYHSPFGALFGKISVYVLIISLWHGLWQAWLIGVRGWFVAGSLFVLIIGQLLFYLAYALFGAMVVLKTQNINKSYGILAVYGGSSMSFAGVTLPLNNASGFTQFWSQIIPFTPFARLQVEQWVIGSPFIITLAHLNSLLIFVLIFGIGSLLLLRHIKKTLIAIPNTPKDDS